MFLGWNELVKDKKRYILIILVIILVSYLVFFLTSLAYGLSTSYTQAVDKWGASGIILQDGANGNLSRSRISKDETLSIQSNNIEPLLVGNASLEAADEDVAIFGVDRDGFIKPDVVEGEIFSSDNEVVVDDSLKSIVNLGDELKFKNSDISLKVVGFSSNDTFQTSPVVFVNQKTWEDLTVSLLGATGMSGEFYNALIVKSSDNPENLPDGLVFQSMRDFAFSLPGYRPQVLTFSMMIGFLIAISSFVLAIFMYILTLQKKSVFGILKAEGVSGWYIGFSVIFQTLILTILGLLIGLGLTLLSGLFLADKMPFLINWLYFGGIIDLFMIFAVIGAMASVATVLKIDPVEAIG